VELLKATGINLFYDGTQVLRDINFEISNSTNVGRSKGRVVSLIGRSGIGKTSLLRILAGFIKPNSGQVTIGPDRIPVRAGLVGIVNQNCILFNHRTVFQNLEIGLNNCVRKSSSSEVKDVIQGFASRFHLTEQLNKFPAQLSGGQKQRVSIIQQVLTGNKLLLLDEPFASLDPIMKDKTEVLLLEIADLSVENVLMVVSHNIAHALAISDTVFILARQQTGNGATITEIINLSSLGFCNQTLDRPYHELQDFITTIKSKI